MNSIIITQDTFYTEDLVTHTTFTRPLSRMNSFVTIKTVSLCDRIATDDTILWSLSSVLLFVNDISQDEYIPYQIPYHYNTIIIPYQSILSSHIKDKEAQRNIITYNVTYN